MWVHNVFFINKFSFYLYFTQPHNLSGIGVIHLKVSHLLINLSFTTVDKER